MKLGALAFAFLLLYAATPARADCHWAWHCDRVAGCGFVPFCDSPDDKPPPFQGAKLTDEEPQVRPPGRTQRKPLPGYKPINPPPPAVERENGKSDSPKAAGEVGNQRPRTD